MVIMVSASESSLYKEYISHVCYVLESLKSNRSETGIDFSKVCTSRV